MKKIEVGMMVKIVIGPGNTRAQELPEIQGYNGHIGRVIRLYDEHPIWGRRWDVEGACPDNICWDEAQIIPIDPPEEKASWEAIEKATGWSPMREKMAV